MTDIIMFGSSDSPITVVDQEEGRPGDSVSTEKVAPVSKRNRLIDPHTHTVINTQGSSV